METLNIPEAFQDWDWDNDLDVDGHLKKWNQTLREMFTMVIMQLVSNVILLLPFFVTGKILSLKSRFSSNVSSHRRLTVQQKFQYSANPSTSQHCQVVIRNENLQRLNFHCIVVRHCTGTLETTDVLEIYYFLRSLW